MTRITGTLHEDQCTFFITSRSFLLKMRNVSDKSCRENQNTHFVFSNFFFNRTVYETMWKNMVQPDRPQMTVRCMRISCCIPKATNTHSQYVILIALPLQQWLRERASILHYTHIACLVITQMECVYCAVRTGSLNVIRVNFCL